MDARARRVALVVRAGVSVVRARRPGGGEPILGALRRNTRAGLRDVTRPHRRAARRPGVPGLMEAAAGAIALIDRAGVTVVQLARVADAVLVGVCLIRIRHCWAVVTDVADVILVGIFLQRVEQQRTIIGDLPRRRVHLLEGPVLVEVAEDRARRTRRNERQPSLRELERAGRHQLTGGTHEVDALAEVDCPPGEGVEGVQDVRTTHPRGRAIPHPPVAVEVHALPALVHRHCQCAAVHAGAERQREGEAEILLSVLRRRRGAESVQKKAKPQRGGGRKKLGFDAGHE